MQIDSPEKVHTIAALNDRLRVQGLGGQVMVTQSVACLGEFKKAQVLRAIRSFNSFNEGNDPHGERDFVSVDVCGEKWFAKIDCYALDMEHGSEDPSDPKVTRRVLVIMHSSDY